MSRRRNKILLLPFSGIYSAITSIRNWLYNCHILKSTSFKCPIICVGNITVGGTGKSPFTEHLIRLLNNYNPALVSRGYRRKTKGMVIAKPNSKASQIGDEPRQMLNKFPDMPIVADGDRVRAVKYLLANTNTGVILMDDGFQHRSISAGLNIVICDYARPMWNDFTFPAGNLREPWRGYHRADIIIINKCPHDITEEQRDEIIKKMQLRSNQSIFFSAIKYGELLQANGQKARLHSEKNFVAVAGVGRPEPFFDEVKRRYNDVETLKFSDHCNFGNKETNKIIDVVDSMGPNTAVITTEKDATRFPDIRTEVYYIPIEIEILFNQKEELNNKIENYVKRNTRSC